MSRFFRKMKDIDQVASILMRAGMLVGFSVIFMAGCRTMDLGISDALTRPYEPVNVYEEKEEVLQIRRVLILPMAYQPYDAEFLDALDRVFAAELSRTLLFEVVQVSEADMETMFGTPRIASTASMPPDFLSMLKTRYFADAAVLVDLTHYSPYKPIAIGLRSKLVDLENGTVHWAFDDVFDIADPNIAVAARHYFRARERHPIPYGDWNTVVRSPLKFSNYVAYEVFGTFHE